MKLRCSRCKRAYPLHTRRWRCPCGELFALEDSEPFKRRKIDKREKTLWCYRAMMPTLKAKTVVSLGEGGTPLVRAHIENREILCKLEYLSPTGSFKDRGTTVLASFMKEWGIPRAIDDSSGNAAASLAAYGARAGIGIKIFAPAHASPAKLAQIKIFGAELCPVEGPRDKAAEAAQAAASEDYYASHVYNPLVLEGLKTFAFELWEQLDGRTPDVIFFPTGHGSFLRGTFKGFAELRAAGLLKKMPRLFAVQAESISPLRRAWEARLDENSASPEDLQRDAAGGPASRTIAEGIAVSRPVHWASILKIVRETRGSVITVNDSEILIARDIMAHQGLFIEPTSAAAIAGLRQLSHQNQIKPRERVLVPLTGSGLKSPP